MFVPRSRLGCGKFQGKDCCGILIGKRRSKYEIQLSVPFLKKKGVFLLPGFVTVPLPYFVKKLGMLSDSQMELIENGLRDWLSL